MFINREAIIDIAKDKVTKAATEAIAGALPGMLTDALSPALPDVTGGALPAPAAGGDLLLPLVVCLDSDLCREEF